jgi:hypothetical protein
MSEKYPASKTDIIALGWLAVFVAIIILLASIFKSAPANAFPSDWGSDKACSDAGNRPGTDKPAWCPEFREDGSIGCVPCPKDKPAQVRQTGGRKPA